jgi:hypothetical protein
MPVVVSTSCQTRWKDSCAPSSQTGLTVVANGEEVVSVLTQDRTLVPAGIDAPTVAPTVSDGGTGVLPAGSVAYLYCYASSQYPGVAATTTAGGFLYPKSQPSPVSATYTITANHRNIVTCTTTNAAGIDKILVYRAPAIIGADSPPDYTSIVAKAGQAFFVGMVDNNSSLATVNFIDNIPNGGTQEELEVDNFTAPQAQFVVYIDPYWYMIGNFDLDVAVTLDASGNATAVANTFFIGRQGQPGIREKVTFDGITTGGFDGKGTFYFKYNSDSVANVSVLDDLSDTASPGYTGTTVMHVKGFAGNLYRSKARNPFAWGYTSDVGAGDTRIRLTQTFEQTLGGYAVAMAVLPQQQILKIDLERPSHSVAINVSLQGLETDTNFNQACQFIDTRYIVTAHFSQFPCLLNNGQTALRGIDTGNFAIVQGDAGGQAPVSDEIKNTLRTMEENLNYARLFHGCYDARTELSCFWIKTCNDPANLVSIDTCLLYHGPTGQWSSFRDMDVTASASIYDPVTLTTFTLVGTRSGFLCEAFAKGVFTQYGTPFAQLLDPPVNTSPPGYLGSYGIASPQPTGFIGSWAYVIPAIYTYDGSNNPVYFTSATSSVVLMARVTSIIPAGLGGGIVTDAWLDPTTNTVISPTVPFDPANQNYVLCVGLINCEAMTYFQPSATVSGQMNEMWASVENVDYQSSETSTFTGLVGQLYAEFDTFPYGPAISLKPDKRGDRVTDSSNWTTSNRVPSSLMTSFGIRIIERGFEDFTLRSFTLKGT